jgi:hypothetical protein
MCTFLCVFSLGVQMPMLYVDWDYWGQAGSQGSGYVGETGVAPYFI